MSGTTAGEADTVHNPRTYAKHILFYTFKLIFICRIAPDNIDDCLLCDEEGEMVCCDTCENAIHFECLGLDPKNQPKDDWFCPACDSKHEFTFVIMNGNHSKKTEFSLPEDIKSYFSGVGEGIQYDPHQPTDVKNQRYYMPVPHIPRLTKPAKDGTATPGYHDANLTKLMENGHVVLCNKCGLSSDGERPIVKCDYCPSRFHMDCLDPPRAIPPNPVSGWMCPNHVTPDDMISSKIVDGRLQERRVRRAKNCVLVDVDTLPTYDHETTFDDDWRERRLRVPAGDLVMDFIGAVKDDQKYRNEELVQRIKRRMVQLTTLATKDLMERSGVQVPKPWLDQFQSLLHTEARRVRTGYLTDEEADAADVLLGLAQTATAAHPGPTEEAGSAE